MNSSPASVPSGHYSTTARVLHWAVAALIVAQLVLAQLAQNAAQSDRVLERLALLANHKSLGLTLLVLVVVRLLFRLRHPAPPLPSDTPRWQRLASQASHGGLYALMLAMPLSGLVMSAASAYGLSWFNLIEIPRLIAPNELLSELAKSVHAVLGYALVTLVLIHILAACYHHWVRKDDILKRITSTATPFFFGAMLVGTVMLLTPSPGEERPQSGATDKFISGSHDADISSTPDTALALWNIDYARSAIEFTAEQAGARFTGQWQQWSATLALDELPERVRMDVSINVASPNTRDAERDTTLQDADWFDAAQFPTATFSLDDATLNADGSYTGTGALKIKGLSHPTTFHFSISQGSGRRTLTGRARLDRLALGIGTGEWVDTSWVGQFVDVNVTVVEQ